MENPEAEVSESLGDNDTSDWNVVGNSGDSDSEDDGWGFDVTALTPATPVSDDSAFEGDWDRREAPNWTEYIEPPPTISFLAPLPVEAKTLEINNLKINGHPFLSSFLQQRRYTDIHFRISHRLLNYVMHLSEEAAFEFLCKYKPECTFVAGRPFKSADELELHKWVRMIIEWQYDSMIVHHALAGEAMWNDLSKLRDYATHSWVWDTDLIRAAVHFLAMIRDATRLTSLEQVLEIVYRMQQVDEKSTITEAEKEIVDQALGLIPSTNTLNQVTSRAVELLERSCYNFWDKYNPQELKEQKWHFPDRATFRRLPPGTHPFGWDCPERVELQRWNDLFWAFEQFPPREKHWTPEIPDSTYIQELLWSAVDLRNCAAHRDVKSDRRTLEIMLDDAYFLATELGDDEAADEILDLLVKDILKPIFDEQKPRTEEIRRRRERIEDAARADWERHNQPIIWRALRGIWIALSSASRSFLPF